MTTNDNLQSIRDEVEALTLAEAKAERIFRSCEAALIFAEDVRGRAEREWHEAHRNLRKAQREYQNALLATVPTPVTVELDGVAIGRALAKAARTGFVYPPKETDG